MEKASKRPRKKKHKPDWAKLLYEDGATVVRYKASCWSGSAWVHTWEETKFYRPCTREGLVALEEAERLTGVKCCLSYLPPQS